MILKTTQEYEEAKRRLLAQIAGNTYTGEMDMACSCHGKKGEASARVRPYDQCTTCAHKHVNEKAWLLWNEFTYTEDNREAIAGNLRAAADHLMYDHKETALLARNLAVMIESAKDNEITDEWDKLREAVRNHFYEDNPDIAKRLKLLKERE